MRRGGRPTGGRGSGRPGRSDPGSRPRPSRADRPAPTSRTGAKPARRASVTGRAAVLALVVGILAVSYAYPLRAWWDQHARVAELEGEQEELAAGVADLETRLQRWDDPAHVRAQARERLGYVTPGEVGFVVVGEADPEPTEVIVGGDGISGGAPVQTEGAWWSKLRASLVAADEPPGSTDDGAGSGAVPAEQPGPPADDSGPEGAAPPDSGDAGADAAAEGTGP